MKRPAPLDVRAPACATIVHDFLASVVIGPDALDMPAVSDAMVARCAMRAAPDRGLCDLRARRRPVGPQGPPPRTCPCTASSSRCRERVPVYGSGGFTTYHERPPGRSARPTGSWAAHSPREDQDRGVLGHRRPPAILSECTQARHRHRRRRRAVRRRERRLCPQAGDPGRPRPRRPPTCAGSRSPSLPTISTGLRADPRRPSCRTSRRGIRL